MEYQKLASVYERLEITPAKLEKTDIIAGLLGETPDELLDIVPSLLMGRIFPDWSQLELGMGPGLLYDSVCFITGVSKDALKDTIRDEGDVGKATEKLLEKKVQSSLFSKKLEVREVYEKFEKIAGAAGAKSQDKMKRILSDLLNSATPSEAKYITRTVLDELRVGVAEGLVRDAIALAFDVPKDAVERAYMITNDFGVVAKTAKAAGEKGLQGLKMKIGVPLKPMLSQIAPSIDDVLGDVEDVAFEIKYDGARLQIHKNGSEVRLFSRRLEEVTQNLPDIVEYAKKAIKEDAIVEGEAVAIDPVTRKPRAFQYMLKRFRRKYDIERMAKEIPFETYLFDVLYARGKSQIDEPFKNRRKLLEEIIEPIDKKFELAKQRITHDASVAEEFYNEAIEMGHEGLMIKNRLASYTPGARVKHMYKIKPVMETLDLVIVGALWGTGKRTGWLSSYVLGAKDMETGEFTSVGRVGTGVTEEQLQEFTDVLKPLIEYESGGEVRLHPDVVVEVAFQEIQESPQYKSGFALRFPRVMRIREDKSPSDAETLERLKVLYEAQRGQAK
ncbi:ATP-dependent DNA ligase [archaeon]|nr:ATP-dependent DNA ligase [archaeon]